MRRASYRRLAFASVIAVPMLACGSELVLGTPAAEGADAALPDGASDAPVFVSDPDAAVPERDGGTVDPDAGGAGCFGRAIDGGVLFCDDFEAPSLNRTWSVTRSTTGKPTNGTANAVVQITMPGQGLDGGQALALGFDLLPDNGTASVRLKLPNPTAFALQVWIRVPADAWGLGEEIELAALKKDDTAIGRLMLQVTGDNKFAVFLDGSGSLGAFPISTGKYDCFELVWEPAQLAAGTLHAFHGSDDIGSTGSLDTPNITELAMTWAYGASNSSKVTYFDDVILSTSRLGCPATPH